MSTRGSGANLVQAVKDLSFEWQETKTYWHDIKSHEFERKYMEKLPAHVARALTVIEEIDALLRKVKNDCE